MTVRDLIQYGYLTKHYSELRGKDYNICTDIPECFLEFVPMSKGEVNDILGEAMAALCIPHRKLIRLGVCFNFNWYWTRSEFRFDKIYKIYNHYKRRGLKTK